MTPGQDEAASHGEGNQAPDMAGKAINEAIDAHRGKVASSSDQRTVNNTDAVRHNYRVLSDAEKARMVELKNAGQAFLDLCQDNSREMALARTNAEQAVMWAVKHITK